MFALSAVALASFLSVVSALQINTPPGLTECQPVLVQWTSGTAPYYISVIPGGQPSAAPLINFGQQSGTQLTWTVNVTAGTSVTLQATDSTGANAYSSPITVTAGTDSSCIGGSASASTAAGGSVSAAAGQSTSASGTSTVALSASSGTSSAASAESSASSAATSAASAVSKALSSASSALTSASASASKSASSSASASATTSASSAQQSVALISGDKGLLSAVLMVFITGVMGFAWL